MPQHWRCPLGSLCSWGHRPARHGLPSAFLASAAFGIGGGCPGAGWLESGAGMAVWRGGWRQEGAGGNEGYNGKREERKEVSSLYAFWTMWTRSLLSLCFPHPYPVSTGEKWRCPNSPRCSPSCFSVRNTSRRKHHITPYQATDLSLIHI